MRPHPHKIPDRIWRHLDDELREHIQSQIDYWLEENYKKEYSRAVLRGYISGLYEAIPRPVFFALVASLFSFLALALLPLHPMSMVIAFGLGLIIALALVIGLSFVED